MVRLSVIFEYPWNTNIPTTHWRHYSNERHMATRMIHAISSPNTHLLFFSHYRTPEFRCNIRETGTMIWFVIPIKRYFSSTKLCQSVQLQEATRPGKPIDPSPIRRCHVRDEKCDTLRQKNPSTTFIINDTIIQVISILIDLLTESN